MAQFDRWDFNGPEEGDEVDLSVVVMFDGEEVMQLDGDMDDLRARKTNARKICALLNAADWRALT